MASKVKRKSTKGKLLAEIAKRGEYGFPTDYRGFPPGKIMQGVHKAGLVYMERKHYHSWGSTRPYGVNRWFLTDKGKRALGIV